MKTWLQRYGISLTISKLTLSRMREFDWDRLHAVMVHQGLKKMGMGFLIHALNLLPRRTRT